MTKLPINQNVPLENDECELHGPAVWAWMKEGKFLYAFDKYWRKVPTKRSYYGCEFASEQARAEALPITAEQLAQVVEEPTDPVNYDYLFGIVEEETEAEGEETTKPDPEENAPTILPTPAKWPALLRIAARALNEMADALEK